MFKRNLARGRIACFKGLAEKRFDFPPENRSRAAVTCHTKEPTSVLLKNYSNLPTKRKFFIFYQEPIAINQRIGIDKQKQISISFQITG